MKRSAALLFVLFVACVFSSCGPSRTTEGVPSPGYNYSKVVAAIVKLHSDADDEWDEKGQLTKHVDPDPRGRLPGEFDPNAYFGVLKHLLMSDDLVLDFVYFLDFWGGRPFLYARQKTAEPYKTFGEYDKALGGKWLILQAQRDALVAEARKAGSGRSLDDALREFRQLLEREGEPWRGSRAVLDAETGFLDKVRADGSPESFFELAVLYELGGQFYLDFHDWYDDTRIVASPRDVQEIIKELERDPGHLVFTRDQTRRAKRMDVRPRVRFISEDTAEVSLVTFSDWGGFTRNTYRIRRDFPHKIVEMPRETLVEYDCGGVI
jgi:hypothetical protein